MRLREALTLTLAGLAIVVLDTRAQGFDLLPDPAGHALAAGGVLAARRGGVPTGWATLGAAAFLAAAVLAVPDVQTTPRAHGGFDVRPPQADVLVAVRGFVQDVALGATMAGLARAAAAHGATSLARHARALAWTFAASFAAGLAYEALRLTRVHDAALLALALVLLVAEIAAFVLALVLLWRGRDLAPPAATPTPPASGQGI